MATVDSPGSPQSMVRWTCGHCKRGVAQVAQAHRAADRRACYFLICPDCQDGSVLTLDGAVYPSAPAGSAVRNLPSDVSHAWQEARKTHAIAAYTASEIMCRKILMHVAVDAANAPEDKNFARYVEILDEKGFIAAGIKPAITRVKDRGNAANHDLPASTEAQSLETLGITEHLLTSVYAFAEPEGSAP